MIFGLTLLLAPFSGGEFMPHLNEGALLGARNHAVHNLVRGSFENAPQSTPRSRNRNLQCYLSYLSNLRGEERAIYVTHQGRDFSGQSLIAPRRLYFSRLLDNGHSA